MKEANDKGNTKESNFPRNNVVWAFMAAVESRAGGDIDYKRSETEQTNGKGMNCMENWDKIFTALMGLYPPANGEMELLGDVTPKWGRLAASLYDVQYFLKSQQKRCPKEYDALLF